MAARWLKNHAHQIGLTILASNYWYHHHNYLTSFFRGKPVHKSERIDQDYNFPTDFESSIDKACTIIEQNAANRPKEAFHSGIEGQGNFSYKGELQRPTGEGILVSPESGIKMIGKFTNGQLNGEGMIVFQNDGQKFKGILKDGVLEGPGILDLDRAFKYEGNFRESKPSGSGRYSYKDGKTCIIKEGTNKSNERDFAKCYDLYKRLIYEGDWSNGNFNGEGIFYFGDGRRYEGDFNEGQMDGQGKLFDPYGDLEYRGTYTQDYRVDSINKYSDVIISGAVILSYILTRFIP